MYIILQYPKRVIPYLIVKQTEKIVLKAGFDACYYLRALTGNQAFLNNFLQAPVAEG